MWPEGPVSLFVLFISDETKVSVSAWHRGGRACSTFYLTWHSHGILETDTFCCSYWLLRVVVRMWPWARSLPGLLEAGAGSSSHTFRAQHCNELPLPVVLDVLIHFAQPHRVVEGHVVGAGLHGGAPVDICTGKMD